MVVATMVPTTPMMVTTSGPNDSYYSCGGSCAVDGSY